ncbi:MAG: NAD+ synthase [Candidatus Omnitrophota bacterium]|nr:NAD+ synthase [Candidatus Omnitrophota bacterium]
MKKKKLRIALAQINCTVGDIEGNARKILEYVQRAKSFEVDVISFPELAITGYPPEDLLLKDSFVGHNLKRMKDLARQISGGILAIVGFVDKDKNKIYNAAGLIYQGKIAVVYHKIHLPNYGVFDEKRYFTPGTRPALFSYAGFMLGVNICEDIWLENGPLKTQAKNGASLIININASPYHMGKIKEREALISRQAKENKIFISYTNLVGGQDELVFDGQSMVIDNGGRVITRLEGFKEDLAITDLELDLVREKASSKSIVISSSDPLSKDNTLLQRLSKSLEPVSEVYQALELGLRDYVYKNGFQRVVIGLSGGVDSALVAALARDALGKENVTGIFMPSRYSSVDSDLDATRLAENLGIKLMRISIEHIYKIYLILLEPHFIGSSKDVTEENLQARIRGNLLMALSNKFGWLVLTTGNKSEMSTGYATLYGDMAGGLSVIKDVPKNLVYKLARYRNSQGPVIPERILTKEPTAELRPNQKDSDSLPKYKELDPILKAYVEDDLNLKAITGLGFSDEVVTKVINLVDRSEYKRRQAPPGIKITPKAFGRDRRMPITNKFRS